MSSRMKTGIFILLWVATAIVFDIFIFTEGGTEATISHVIMSWSYNHPSMVFAIGFLMGHLFWRIRKPPEIQEIK